MRRLRPLALGASALPVLGLAFLLTWACRKWDRPPDVPSLPVPGSGAVDRDTGVTLSWSCSDPDEDDVLKYDVYLGTTVDPPRADSDLSAAEYHPESLAFSTLYRWRVVARDKHGYATSGSVWSFTTVKLNHAPNKPHAPSPDSGAADWPVRTLLYWSGGDADTSDSVTYDVFFGTSVPPPVAVQGRTDTSYAPGSLGYTTVYYWRVVAHDNHDATTEGPLWRFTTSANHPPNTPANPTPGNTAQGQLLRLTLSWDGGDPDSWDIVRYDVYLGTSMQPPRVDSNRSIDSISVGRLKYDSTYYWKVVAHDDHSGRTEGPLWQFRTIAPVRVTAPESLASIRAFSVYQVTWTGGPSGTIAYPAPRVPEARSAAKAGRASATLPAQMDRLGTAPPMVRKPAALPSRPALRSRILSSPPLSRADSTVVSYSADNGTTWLRQGKATTPGSFYLTIPYPPTTSARVKVCAYAAPDTFFGVSSRFTVLDTLPPSAITITSPNYNSHWTIGTQHDVTWTGGTDGFDSAVVFYSADSQRTWARQGRTTTPGAYRSWTVPGPATNNAFVIVRAWCRALSSADTSVRFYVANPPYPDSVIATVPVGGQPRVLCWDSTDNCVYVANYTDSSVMVIDSANRVADTVVIQKFPVALVWNRTGNKLYVASELNAVTVVNCATNTVTKTIAAAKPVALCWNALNNKVYVAGNRDSSVTIIDGTTDSVIARANVGASPNAIAWNPTANKVYVTNSASNSVSVIDGATNLVIHTEPVNYAPSAVALDVVHNKVYVANRNGNSVTVIDGASNQTVWTVSIPQEPWALAWNALQSQTYCAASGANVVAVVDTFYSVIRNVGVGTQPRSLVWADYVNKLYVANYGSASVSLIDCATNSVSKTLTVGNRPTALCWNPSQSRIYVANQDDGTVSVIGR